MDIIVEGLNLALGANFAYALKLVTLCPRVQRWDFYCLPKMNYMEAIYEALVFHILIQRETSQGEKQLAESYFAEEVKPGIAPWAPD